MLAFNSCLVQFDHRQVSPNSFGPISSLFGSSPDAGHYEEMSHAMFPDLFQEGIFCLHAYP